MVSGSFPPPGCQLGLCAHGVVVENRIQGNVACTQYSQSELAFRSDTNVQQVYNRTINFYQTLWGTFFQGTFPSSMANFFYAYELYDYAQYEYEHNPQVASLLNPSELSLLAALAETQQRDLNGNLTASGKYSGDMVRAISGRMLAAKVVEMFRESISSEGLNNKLNLMFGSFEPFIAFFALSNLVNSASAANFEALPGPGAAMVFELFSVNLNTSTYPDSTDLWVRFLYRPDTNPQTPFTEYPLFGNGNSQSRMRFPDFVNAMDAVAITSVAGWCDICDSINLFCGSLEGSGYYGSSPSGSGSSGSGIVPAVAGVIGAVVTLAVIGLAAVAAVVLGHIRFYRADRQQRASSLGGFKGAEKMASDTDLAVSKGGGRHERIGSWELRGDPDEAGVVAAVGAVLDKDTAVSGMKNIDDDAISDLGVPPTRPRESF